MGSQQTFAADSTDRQVIRTDRTAVVLRKLQAANEVLAIETGRLRSANEELLIANEEAQAYAEEIETLNEELQATNEELETLNDELQRRGGQLNEANTYLSSVLTSLRAAVVVVDREMLVQAWNRAMEEMWGLRADEVTGHPLLHLDVGLPVEQLKAPVRSVLDGRADLQEVTLDAVNRRGRAVRCRITVSPLMSPAREIRGSVVVIEEADAPPFAVARSDGAG